MIDRFGWEVVHSAPAKKLRRMILAENVYRSYSLSKKASGKDGGLVQWEKDNPQLAKTLKAAMIARSEVQNNGVSS